MWLKRITSNKMDKILYHGALICLRFLAQKSQNPFIAGTAIFLVQELEGIRPLLPKRKSSLKSSGKRVLE